MVHHFIKVIKNSLRNLSQGAMFISLAVGSGFALVLVPNVELITSIVFLSGAYLGSRWGMVIGGIAEFLFSALNPMGSGFVFFPILIAQVLGMMLVGAVGGFFEKFFLTKEWSSKKRVLLGITGFFLTFQFDALTTFSYPLAMGYPMMQSFAIFFSGIAFTFIYQITNGIIFALILPKVFIRLKLLNMS